MRSGLVTRLRLERKLYRRAMRRGLAPLELVLWLPVMLMVMALIVNYDNMTCWRVRGEVVARDAVWRTRWPRSGGAEPRPSESIWPAGAGMGVRGGSQIWALNHPNINHPVARGPVLELGDPPNRFTVKPTLDQETGSVVGVSHIDRDYPLLASLGRYHSGEIAHPLLRKQWQCAQMGFSNNRRRTLELYILPRTDPGLPEAYVQSVLGLIRIPHFAALSVLDRDEDWRIFYGGYPNFYPRISPNYGETDRQVVYDRSVRRKVDQINARGEVVLGEIGRLPRRMTTAFLRMYQGVKREIERLEDELIGVPPPAPDRRLWIVNRLNALRQIQNLDQKIEQLQRDITTLDARERQMKEYFRISRSGA